MNIHNYALYPGSAQYSIRVTIAGFRSEHTYRYVLHNLGLAGASGVRNPAECGTCARVADSVTRMWLQYSK
jgi:hypothetical protein